MEDEEPETKRTRRRTPKLGTWARLIHKRMEMVETVQKEKKKKIYKLATELNISHEDADRIPPEERAYGEKPYVCPG